MAGRRRRRPLRRPGTRAAWSGGGPGPCRPHQPRRGQGHRPGPAFLAAQPHQPAPGAARPWPHGAGADSLSPGTPRALPVPHRRRRCHLDPRRAAYREGPRRLPGLDALHAQGDGRGPVCGAGGADAGRPAPGRGRGPVQHVRGRRPSRPGRWDGRAGRGKRGGRRPRRPVRHRPDRRVRRGGAAGGGLPRRRPVGLRGRPDRGARPAARARHRPQDPAA